uniref:Prolyl 4-hydroxylase N-terminal domain-containing protein n=1 Tax=Amazona collaria TaxID=241587 RepID=A0A8B9G539_9PSIT
MGKGALGVEAGWDGSSQEGAGWDGDRTVRVVTTPSHRSQRGGSEAPPLPSPLPPRSPHFPPPGRSLPLPRAVAAGPMRALGLGVLLALLPPPAPAETFSAMRSVRAAMGAEGRLLRRLRAYLREESARLRRLTRFYEKVHALHQDPQASVDNPLLAFSLIKRLYSDWPNVIYSDEATENTQGRVGRLQCAPLCHLGRARR